MQKAVGILNVSSLTNKAIGMMMTEKMETVKGIPPCNAIKDGMIHVRNEAAEENPIY